MSSVICHGRRTVNQVHHSTASTCRLLFTSAKQNSLYQMFSSCAPHLNTTTLSCTLRRHTVETCSRGTSSFYNSSSPGVSPDRISNTLVSATSSGGCNARDFHGKHALEKRRPGRCLSPRISLAGVRAMSMQASPHGALKERQADVEEDGEDLNNLQDHLSSAGTPSSPAMSSPRSSSNDELENPPVSTATRRHAPADIRHDVAGSDASHPPSADIADRQLTGDCVRLHVSPPGDSSSSVQSFGRGWKPMYQIKLQGLPSMYMKLSKSRLTGLVVITAMAGYVAAPGAFDLTTFLAVSAGTCMCSAAANAVNQTMEVPYDAQMARTRSRVLVRAQLSPLHSAGFAAASVVAGTAGLVFGCNTLTGCLGLMNFFLYTSAYTPLKRITIWNTWVGSVVGALPPLMGWAACTGSIADPAAWIMPLVLYSWQFPHFHGLSWARRDDYSRGGYVMTAVTDPAMCRRVALRHCAALFALGLAVPYAGLTSWWFVCGGAALVNGYFTVLGWQFYRKSNVQSARKLFQFSLIHLIVLMGLLVIGAVSKDAPCVGRSATKPDNVKSAPSA